MDMVFLVVGLVVGFGAAWVIRGLKASQGNTDPQAITKLENELKEQRKNNIKLNKNNGLLIIMISFY